MKKPTEDDYASWSIVFKIDFLDGRTELRVLPWKVLVALDLQTLDYWKNENISSDPVIQIQVPFFRMHLHNTMKEYYPTFWELHAREFYN